MSLTHCTTCRGLTFVDATSCPSCARSFQPDELRAQALAEEQHFRRRYSALFLGALLVIIAVGIFFALRA